MDFAYIIILLNSVRGRSKVSYLAWAIHNSKGKVLCNQGFMAAAAAAMLWSGISNHGNSQFTGMIWIPITLHHLTLYPTSNTHFFSKLIPKTTCWKWVSWVPLSYVDTSISNSISLVFILSQKETSEHLHWHISWGRDGFFYIKMTFFESAILHKRAIFFDCHLVDECLFYFFPFSLLHIMHYNLVFEFGISCNRSH